MLVKNIVKSTFFLLTFLYSTIIFCKKVLSFKYYRTVPFGNQRGFIMGQRVLKFKFQDSRPKTFRVLKRLYFKDIFTQDQQVSKIATFWGTSLRIWALNAGLVFKFTSQTVDPDLEGSYYSYCISKQILSVPTLPPKKFGKIQLIPSLPLKAPFEIKVLCVIITQSRTQSSPT